MAIKQLAAIYTQMLVKQTTKENPIESAEALLYIQHILELVSKVTISTNIVQHLTETLTQLQPHTAPPASLISICGTAMRECGETGRLGAVLLCVKPFLMKLMKFPEVMELLGGLEAMALHMMAEVVTVIKDIANVKPEGLTSLIVK